MKIRKINVKNIDTEELEPAEQLICDCGSENFIVYSLADNHTHLQCSACGEVACSKRPPVATDEESEEWDLSE